MKKASNMSKKLIAILLSAAMTFTPMMQSMPVYAAETQNETEDVGTMPQADELDDAVSDNDSDAGDAEEAPGEEQNPDAADAGDDAKDDVSDDHSKDDASDDGKDADTGKVEENTEEKTETKEDTKPSETVLDPVYEEVLEEESDSVSGSEEESETETEEMSLEDVRASFSNIKASDIKAGGWNESIYAEISKVTDASAITKVSWTGTDNGELDTDGLKYLVRIPEGETGVRIDIPGLKAGTYRLSITVKGSGELTYAEDIKVYAYDRSGYAHFKYTDGVGAYKDDGTLKNNVIVLYVTDENKNDVELTVGNTTVRGIGNILNTVGRECSDPGHEKQCKRVSKGKTYYGAANTNQGIIEKLSEADISLVVRFIGTVSESGKGKQTQYDAKHEGLIDGLTAYSSDDYGGIPGDNGHMARIKSGKNITLEGIGYDAVIDGWGFHFMAESATAGKGFGKGFEVRNLKFINTPEDAIGMEGIQEGGKITAGVERCWIHNNEFYGPDIVNPAESDKSEGDGSVDFKRGQYFTCSYNYFEGCHKTNLVGSSDSSLQYNLTFHHNHWYLCKARGPLGRQANMHMYNNIVEMQTDFAQNTRANAYIFSEYNMFYACKNPQRVDAGAIKSYHDTIASVEGKTQATVVEDKSDLVSNNCSYQGTDYSKFDTDETLCYIKKNNYKLDTDFTELRKVVTSQTGVQDRYPKLAKDITSESEYSIMPKDATLTTITTSEYEKTNFKKSKIPWAFTYNGNFDIEIEYSGTNGVLVNAAGENLLEGNGTVRNLPEGTYWIQCVNISAGDAKDLTPVTFKEVTIKSIKITPTDPNKHYHNWVLDTATEPTCTTAGKKVYKCEGSGTCDAEKPKEEEIPALGHDYTVPVATITNPTCEEAGEGTFKCSRCDLTYNGTVPALGHAWGEWQVVTAATAETDGVKKHVCSRCNKEETDTIPKGSTGSGDDDSSDGVVFHGDYVLTFEGGRANGATDFFTLTGGSYENTTEKRTPTVNGKKYQACYRLSNTEASIKFTCEDDMILFIAASTDQSDSSIKINGTKTPIDNKATLTKELTAGEYTITKDSQLKICYLAVAYKTSVVYHTISFVYNYSGEDDEDEPDPKTMSVAEGQTYSTMAALVPSSFTRSGYTLKGLYEDAACTKPVGYPYKVNKDIELYAQWEEDDTLVEETWMLYLNTNGGVGLAPVSVSKSQIYEITQKPTRTGYAFAGWYDAAEGGKLISFVDGSKMTGDVTVYAHWNALEIQDASLSLDCATDLNNVGTATTDGRDIKETTTVKGFKIHATSGGGGTTGDKPKYYMTVKGNMLYTNGVLLTDTTISENSDGLLKAIEFEAPGAGILTVRVAVSGELKTDTCNIVLGKKDANNTLSEVNKYSLTSTSQSNKEFEITSAGTYYLYATGTKGVAYSSIKFTQPQYTVVYKPGIAAASGSFESVLASAGDPITLPTYTPKTGYTFKGWALENTTDVITSYTVDAEDAVNGVITIVALYDAKEYTIKYDANGGTPPQTAQETRKNAGDTINLTEIGNCTPPEGYIFKGWEVGSGDSIRTVVTSYTVDGDDADNNDVITLTAVYEKEGTGDNEDPSDKKTGMEIVGVADSYEFTGAKIIPDIEVWDYDNNGGKLLAPDVDYKVTYKNNVKISTNETDPKKQPQVIVTGKGNYAGKGVTKSFKIVPVEKVTQGLLNLKGAKIDKIPDEKYELEFVNGNSKGKPHYPDFKLTVKGDNNTTITETYGYDSADGVYKVKVSEDSSRKGKPIAANVAVSNNVNKGTATILITGGKNKDTDKNATSVKKTFKITAIDLNEADVKVGQIAPVEYAVNGAVPTGINVTIKSDGKVFTLKQGKDYTVKYANNKKATTGQEKKATVTITGKGNFAKKYNKEKVEYEITQLDMSKLKVNAVTACDGMKPGKVKATVVDKNGATLKASQYTVKVYAAETGDALCEDTLAANNMIHVAVEAKDVKNLTGATKREPFKVGKDFSKAKIVLNKGEDGKVITKEYTGSAINLTAGEITVSYRGETENLKPGKDYEIAECINNVNKGTATAIVKGIGDYSGTKTVKFKIVGKDMTINNRWTAWENFKGFLNGLTKQTK